MNWLIIDGIAYEELLLKDIPPFSKPMREVEWGVRWKPGNSALSYDNLSASFGDQPTYDMNNTRVFTVVDRMRSVEEAIQYWGPKLNGLVRIGVSGIQPGAWDGYASIGNFTRLGAICTFQITLKGPPFYNTGENRRTGTINIGSSAATFTRGGGSFTPGEFGWWYDEAGQSAWGINIPLGDEPTAITVMVSGIPDMSTVYGLFTWYDTQRKLAIRVPALYVTGTSGFGYKPLSMWAANWALSSSSTTLSAPAFASQPPLILNRDNGMSDAKINYLGWDLPSNSVALKLGGWSSSGSGSGTYTIKWRDGNLL